MPNRSLVVPPNALQCHSSSFSCCICSIITMSRLESRWESLLILWCSKVFCYVFGYTPASFQGTRMWPKRDTCFSHLSNAVDPCYPSFLPLYKCKCTPATRHFPSLKHNLQVWFIQHLGSWSLASDVHVPAIVVLRIWGAKRKAEPRAVSSSINLRTPTDRMFHRLPTLSLPQSDVECLQKALQKGPCCEF